MIEQVLPWEPHFHLTTSDTGEYTRANNWSHSTMYSFFLVSGIADFLVMKFPKISPHCKYNFKKLKILLYKRFSINWTNEIRQLHQRYPYKPMLFHYSIYSYSQLGGSVFLQDQGISVFKPACVKFFIKQPYNACITNRDFEEVAMFMEGEN